MNNRQSLLDSMNAGRQRRASSLDQLNRSLEELESRIRRPHDEPETGMEARRSRLAAEAAYYEPPHRERSTAQRMPAHDFERARAHEGGIASEMGRLRDELRQQMSTSLQHEFAALKDDLDPALRSSGRTSQAADLGAECQRLSALIDQLAARGEDKNINLLRLEMEQVRNAVGKLAREDTVKSVNRRWDEFDQRWDDLARRAGESRGEAALQALTARIEQIGEAVAGLPKPVVLRSLEDKIKTLAAAVEQFAHQQDRSGSSSFDAIAERLDEISRAVAASAGSAPQASFDPVPFERIEARISSLARQLGEIIEDNPAHGLLEQLNALSLRVDDIAQRVELPDQAIQRLAAQIDAISQRLESAPALPAMDDMFSGLESRFSNLSAMLEQRHEDALAQGQNLFRDLETRLDKVAVRLERTETAPGDAAQLLEAMDVRLAELAASLGGHEGAPNDDAAIQRLEAKLEDISGRLDASASQPGIDAELIRSLEAQVAGLAAHIARPAGASEFGDLGPRLEHIEHSITESRSDVLAAARQAAEEAVRSFSGSSGDGTLVVGLVEDLKALETLTRRSDDRNAKTFEAIHDTLLKIVDRLGSFEAGAAMTNTMTDTGPVSEAPLASIDAPALDAGVDEELARAVAATPSPEITPSQVRRSAATAAAEAAAAAIRRDIESEETPAPGARSMLGGLARALSGRKTKPQPGEPAKVDDVAAIPDVEPDEPVDPQLVNQPLEPGSGAPDLNAIMKRVRDERTQPAVRNGEVSAAKSDFIAAARRAAQAAAAEAEMMKRRPAVKSSAGGLGLGGLLKKRSKPILMGVAAVLLALAALQFGNRFIAGSQEEVADAAPAAIESETTAAAADAEPAAPVKVAALDVDAAVDNKIAAIKKEPPAPLAAAEAEPQSGPDVMTQAPATAADVATDWLEAEEVAAPTADAEIASVDAEAAPAEVEPQERAGEAVAATKPADETLAAIPAEAGPAALREAAAAGDAKALFEIGNRFAAGRGGVAEDMKQAAEWYAKAADLGLAPAQYRLGALYEKGVGVERDIAAAKTLYGKAAEQGNASAMHNLAVLYAMGADGPADNKLAAKWFLEAADLDVKDSQFNLGILYAKGVGKDQDLLESYKWFALVAETGDKDAAGKRDEVAKMLSAEQLEKARAATELWQPKPLDPEVNAVEVPESWRESSDTTAGVDLKQAVRNIQAMLNERGYDAGAADGIMGRKTRDAVAAFQKDSGMKATGTVDEPLVRALLARN